MDKIVEFSKAWDRRDKDPNKNYGIHGVNIRFVLKGELGATQFLLYTNWFLPHNQDEVISRAIGHRLRTEMLLPLPADLGYHSPKQLYEDQVCISEECEYLDGKPCYYGSSGLRAEDVYKRLLSEGDAGVWNELEKEYIHRFGELK